MKDYIVFFTEGFDSHNIKRQMESFPRAHISCINSKPDYNTLINESNIAQKNNFENFYIFWEKDDIFSMNREMKNEFHAKFKETGAIPYKYTKILEQDINAQQAGTVPTGTPAGTTQAAPVGQTVQQNGTGTIPTGVTPTGQTQQNVGVTAGADPNLQGKLNTYNTQYTKNHAATVFIWPFNLFRNDGKTQGELSAFAKALNDDDVGRSPGYTTTSNTTHQKKGNWQRIIYVPQSLKELNQGVARADTLYASTLDIWQTYYFAKNQSNSGAQGIKDILRNLHVGGVKVDYGLLTEGEIVNACRRQGVSNASIRNIHILHTLPYAPYLKWCPDDHHSIISTMTYPNAKLNETQLKGLEAMKNYVSQKKNDANFLKALIAINRGTAENSAEAQTALKNMRKFLTSYDPFWKYWNLYLSQKDVYGKPDGSGAAKDTLTAMGDFLGQVEDLPTGSHTNDLDQFYKAAGWLDKNSSTAENGMFGEKQFRKDLENAAKAIKTMANNASVAKNVVSSALPAKSTKQTTDNNNKEATPHEVYDDEYFSNKQATVDGKDVNKIEKDAEKDANKEGQNANEAEKDQATDKEQTVEKAPEEKPASQEGENTQSGENKESPETAENAEDVKNVNKVDDFDNTELDHILCQLSPIWNGDDTNIGWSVRHSFYGNTVWEDMEGITKGDSKLGYTVERAIAVRKAIEAYLGNNISGVAVDGQTPNSTNVPENAKTTTNQAIINPEGDITTEQKEIANEVVDKQ